MEGGTTGVRSVDIVLIQHLLHCEFLLQHLQVEFTLTAQPLQYFEVLPTGDSNTHVHGKIHIYM